MDALEEKNTINRNLQSKRNFQGKYEQWLLFGVSSSKLKGIFLMLDTMCECFFRSIHSSASVKVLSLSAMQIKVNYLAYTKI